MFHMRLAVETFNAHYQVSISPSHTISLATEQMGEIDVIYEQFEHSWIRSLWQRSVNNPHYPS
ncbi:hypothetical protein ECZC10_54650 [Escherichia coli]|nr:hypothetical protein ECZC10_54650 [Escherichia coli]